MIFVEWADIFSYWGDVPRNVRLHFYLKKARKEQSFMTILEYIEESELSEEDMQRLMKLSDEDILKLCEMMHVKPTGR